MLWNYATLNDEAAIAYGKTAADGTVRIVVERPRDFGFDHAECRLPLCRWTLVDGFSDDEIENLTAFIRDNAPLIFEMADEHRDVA